MFNTQKTMDKPQYGVESMVEQNTAGGLLLILAMVLGFHGLMWLYGQLIPDLLVNNPLLMAFFYVMTLLRMLLPLISGHHRYYTSQFVPEMIKTLRVVLLSLIGIALLYVGLMAVSAGWPLLLTNLLRLILLNAVGFTLLLGALSGLLALIGISMHLVYMNVMKV